MTIPNRLLAVLGLLFAVGALPAVASDGRHLVRLESYPFRGGMGVGVGFEVEQGKWGLSLDSRSYRFDAGASSEALGLHAARITFAPWAGRNGRVRFEAGISGAFTPQLVAFGPSLGVSWSLRLVGPIGVEGAAHVTPFPHSELSSEAGFYLAMGNWAIRAGWRRVEVNDRGLGTGAARVDVVTAPYLGAAVVF